MYLYPAVLDPRARLRSRSILPLQILNHTVQDQLRATGMVRLRDLRVQVAHVITVDVDFGEIFIVE